MLFKSFRIRWSITWLNRKHLYICLIVISVEFWFSISLSIGIWFILVVSTLRRKWVVILIQWALTSCVHLLSIVVHRHGLLLILWRVVWGHVLFVSRTATVVSMLFSRTLSMLISILLLWWNLFKILHKNITKLKTINIRLGLVLSS